MNAEQWFALFLGITFCAALSFVGVDVPWLFLGIFVTLATIGSLFKSDREP